MIFHAILSIHDLCVLSSDMCHDMSLFGIGVVVAIMSVWQSHAASE
jgi:hypothetical protein